MDQTTRSEVPNGVSFHDALAPSWNNAYNRGGFKKRLAFSQGLLSRIVVSGERWLDAGCGAGTLAREMSDLGAIGLAVDGSQQMIDAAMRAAGPSYRAFVFSRVLSVTAINVPKATFDGVLCSSVLEYVDEIDDALLEFNRVLKIGGKLILSVPNRHSLVRRTQKWLRNRAVPLGLKPFSYLSVSVHDFTKEDLLERLSRNGFSTSALEGFEPILHSAFISPALYFAVAHKTSDRPLGATRGESIT